MFKRTGYAALIAITAAAFVIGSAVTGPAKAMKKMAAAPPPFFCMMTYAPVCGVAHGVKSTYANSCFAAKNGATVVYHGACKMHHMMMHHHKMHHHMKMHHHHKAMHKAKKKMAKPMMKKPEMKKPMKK